MTRRRPTRRRAALLAIVLVLAGCGGDEDFAGGAGDLPGPVPEGVRFEEPPSSALPAPALTIELVDGTTVRGDELWDRPYLLVFTASFCERCREIHRAAAAAVDAQEGAAGLVGVVGEDDADAAEYADELDLGYPVGAASERVWRNYAAREPGLVVLVAQGGEVVRGWPSPPTEAALAEALDALIER